MPRMTTDPMKMPKTISCDDLEKWYDAEEEPQTGASSSASSSEFRPALNTHTRRDATPNPREIPHWKISDQKGNYFRKLFLLTLEEGDDVRKHMCTFFSLVEKLMDLEIFINEDLLCALLLSSLPKSFEDAVAPRGRLLSLETLSRRVIQEGDARNGDYIDIDTIDNENKNDKLLKEFIERYKRKQLKDNENEGENYSNSEPGEGNSFPLRKNNNKYSLPEWHNKLGHLNIRHMKELFKSGILKLANFQNFPNDFHCKICDEQKVNNPPFLRSESITARELLEIIHVGVCGPVEVPSLGENSYFVTFTDDLSRYAEVYFIKEKSEVFVKFIDFKAYMETMLDSKIKSVRSEYGTKCLTKEFDNFLKYSGIRSYKPPCRHQKLQNSVSEEKNIILLDMARRLLSQSGLPLYFWAEAVNTANFIQNRSPSAILNYKTPYEVVFRRKPCLSFLKTFGSMGFALIRENFEQKSIRCVFLGYSADVKGYRVFIPELHRLEILKSVTIVDGVFIGECEDLKKFL